MTSNPPQATPRPRTAMAHQDTLGRRAVNAWFRVEGEDAERPVGSGVLTFSEKTYVVLYREDGVMAVYRVRNDGILKRLRRWPVQLRLGA